MLKVIGYISKHKVAFAGAVLLATGTILAGIGLMSTSGYLISRAAQRPMIVDLFMVTAGVRFFGISRAVVRYFERVVSHDLTFKILLSMRMSLYRQIDSFSQKWFMTRRPGDLLAGVTSDIETLQNVFLRIVSPVIVAFLIGSLTFWGLTFFDVKLALVTLLFFILNGIVSPLIIAWLVRGRGKKEVQTRSKLKVFLVDRLQGMQDLSWMGQQKNSLDSFNQMQRELDQIQQKNAGISGLAESLNNLLSHMAMFFVLIMAIPLVMNGEIKGVVLAALTLGVLSSFEAFQGLANAFIQYENSDEAAKRLFSLAENDKTAQSLPARSNKTLQDIPESISFQHVSFSYDGITPTLKNISFSIPTGSCAAVVGPTGSGKSTLLNLLLRFWSPDSGGIKAGNYDINQLEETNYRSLFGVVSQDNWIFNRSLRENLLLAKPEATDQELQESLRRVGLDHFAHDLNMEPGTQGMRFSGGERQLLALARAWLTQSDIWIFDEATAHLDANTERKILDTLWSLKGNKTLLMVTHRLVDMEKMDEILVMSGGQITEKGTHAQLLSQKGIYARMFDLQKEVLD
jgi:ATP-binding cassette subfamily C protein CydC